MLEWGLSPDYILEHWTEDQLSLFIHKRNERIFAEALAEDPNAPRLNPDMDDLENSQKKRFRQWKEAQERSRVKHSNEH